jgi:primary-amine oxidase
MADAAATATASGSTLHPLEPLSGEEIAAAVAILRASGQLPEKSRVVFVVLREPPKEGVLGWQEGVSLPREAALQILDNASGAVYEAIVSLTEGGLTTWTQIRGVQPSIMLDEFFECEDAVKADPDFQAALARRGATDMSLVMVDPWSAGWYGKESEKDQGLRLVRALAWVRSRPGDNGYAHPIEGVAVLVDPRLSPPSATTSTASSGIFTRTDRSNTRSSSPASCTPGHYLPARPARTAPWSPPASTRPTTSTSSISAWR